jgi:hypothetical protein
VSEVFRGPYEQKINYSAQFSYYRKITDYYEKLRPRTKPYLNQLLACTTCTTELHPQYRASVYKQLDIW